MLRSPGLKTNTSCGMSGKEPARKLRLLCLHSFRTSAAIFREQMKRSGLDKKLDSIADFVYLDAPHNASGPPPADVTPFFDPPYREWWNASEDKVTGNLRYDGVQETLHYVSKYIEEHGPFDGCWAFSQGTMLATMLMSLQRQGKLLQDMPLLRFGVIFGGFHYKQKMKSNPVAQEVFKDSWKGRLLDIPSVHIIGDKDSIKALSHQLMDQYKDPILITHPRGHNIPALEGEKLAILEGFLQKQLNGMRESSSKEDSRL